MLLIMQCVQKQIKMKAEKNLTPFASMVWWACNAVQYLCCVYVVCET